MNEQESKDLEELKAKVIREKELIFDILRDTDRATPEHLKYMGQTGKSNAEAMRNQFQSAMKRIEKLHKDYLKKYPD